MCTRHNPVRCASNVEFVHYSSTWKESYIMAEIDSRRTKMTPEEFICGNSFIMERLLRLDYGVSTQIEHMRVLTWVDVNGIWMKQGD